VKGEDEAIGGEGGQLAMACGEQMCYCREIQASNYGKTFHVDGEFLPGFNESNK
jgi:hypothetical protein